MNITDLTTTQLTQIIAIKEQIEALQSQIESIAGGGEGEVPTPQPEEAPAPTKRKYHMSAAHKRKLIKALAKAREDTVGQCEGQIKVGQEGSSQQSSGQGQTQSGGQSGMGEGEGGGENKAVTLPASETHTQRTDGGTALTWE